MSLPLFPVGTSTKSVFRGSWWNQSFIPQLCLEAISLHLSILSQIDQQNLSDHLSVSCHSLWGKHFPFYPMELECIVGHQERQIFTCCSFLHQTNIWHIYIFHWYYQAPLKSDFWLHRDDLSKKIIMSLIMQLKLICK